tara:strand:+ start:4860 stop:5156 length:297 start_codon:yes stop_codon:yes gene_type:complete
MSDNETIANTVHIQSDFIHLLPLFLVTKLVMKKFKHCFHAVALLVVEVSPDPVLKTFLADTTDDIDSNFICPISMSHTKFLVKGNFATLATPNLGIPM